MSKRYDPETVILEQGFAIYDFEADHSSGAHHSSANAYNRSALDTSHNLVQY